jgi:hypothetical protein
MAFPTSVNDQITDEVTQSDVTNLGQSPAVAMGSLYQNMSQTAENAAQNQVTVQNNAQITSSAVTTLAVKTILRCKS